MKLYPRVVPGVFLARPNRFVARCLVDGREETVHVKNTGRCAELLVPGAEVYLAPAESAGRKTAWDLVTVRKGPLLVNIDSQAPNRVFGAWAFEGHFLPGLTHLRSEQRWGESRFDFSFRVGEREGFAEVKGVTLETGSVAYFPDAPTARGLKHVREMCQVARGGRIACVCFVIPLPGVTRLRPNWATHPAFGEALREAVQAGVRLYALTCQVQPDGFSITGSVPVDLCEDGCPELAGFCARNGMEESAR